MKLDPTQRPDAVYRTLSSLVVPRPIGWISTVSDDGEVNLAPYSYFNAVSNDPPTLMFSASNSGGELKDTPQNALDTGEFVFNLVTEDLAETMDATSHSGEGSEFERVGLGREPSETVAPPRVADAKATLECEVSESLEVGSNTLVFGEVTLFHVDESLVSDGDVEASNVDAVGRFGGPYYTRTDLLEFQRQY